MLKINPYTDGTKFISTTMMNSFGKMKGECSLEDVLGAIALIAGFFIDHGKEGEKDMIYDAFIRSLAEVMSNANGVER